MPYKNKVRQREYQCEWAKRKRKKLPTRIVNKPTKKLTNKERRERIKIWNRKGKRKYKQKRLVIKSKYLGESCYFCKRNQGGLQAHRKDGKFHKNLDSISNMKFESELKGGKYVLLCHICHKSVHWCMYFLQITWDDILFRFKKNK